MPDTPFKSMTRDRDSLRPEWVFVPTARYTSVRPEINLGPVERCDACGGRIYKGDWPFCKGNPEDHKRD